VAYNGHIKQCEQGEGGAARFGHETGSVYGKRDEEYSGLVREIEPQDGTEY
jgi:hypothetical protein